MFYILRLIPPPTSCLRPPIVSTGSESPCSRRSCTRLWPTSSKTVKSGPKQQKSQRAKNNTIHRFYSRFYDAGKSVVGDPDLGQILASLIGVVGYMSEMNRKNLHLWKIQFNSIDINFSWPMCAGVHEVPTNRPILVSSFLVDFCWSRFQFCGERVKHKSQSTSIWRPRPWC